MKPKQIADAIKTAYAEYDKSGWSYARDDIRGPFVEYLVNALIQNQDQRDECLNLLEDLPR